MGMFYTSTKEHFSVSEIHAAYACPRKWLHRYVLKSPAKKSDALIFGAAFHEYLEGKPLSQISFEGLRGDIPYEKWCEKMAADMWAKVERAQYQHAETWIRCRGFLGKIDAIRTMPGGRWRLVEYKTTAKIDPDRFQTLSTDLQCNAYMAHRTALCEEIGMREELFDGIEYVQCKKPTVSQKIENFNPETHIDHVAPHHVADCVEVFRVAKRHALFVMDSSLVHYEEKGLKNVSFNSNECRTAYGPCDYFDLCHTKIEKLPQVPAPTPAPEALPDNVLEINF